MATNKRKTTWDPTFQSSRQVLNGAAAPGVVVDEVILAESDIESKYRGATLIRVVGDVIFEAVGGDPVISVVLWFAQAYAGFVRPADWANDELDTRNVIMSWLVMPDASNVDGHIHVDVRSKRKLGGNTQLLMSIQNHAIAGNDARYVYMLKSLLLLP